MAILSFLRLQQSCASPQLDGQQMRSVLDSMFKPRFITIDVTSLTIGEDHRGAILRFTSSSPITVALPSSLDEGFLVSFLPYGTGAITFAAAPSAIGGTGSAGQYKICSAMKLDTGEWLISGGA